MWIAQQSNPTRVFNLDHFAEIRLVSRKIDDDGEALENPIYAIVGNGPGGEVALFSSTDKDAVENQWKVWAGMATNIAVLHMAAQPAKPGGGVALPQGFDPTKLRG